MAWIEVHQSLPTHRKTLLVADALDMPPVHVMGHLVAFWLWALDNAPDGILRDISPRMIARAAQWEGNPKEFVDALAKAGLIDQTSEGYAIHDWRDYAGKLIERRAADRERKKRQGGDPESESNRKAKEDPEEEQKNSAGTPAEIQQNSDGIPAEQQGKSGGIPHLPNRTLPNRTLPNQKNNTKVPHPADAALAEFCQIMGIEDEEERNKLIPFIRSVYKNYADVLDDALLELSNAVAAGEIQDINHARSSLLFRVKRLAKEKAQVPPDARAAPAASEEDAAVEGFYRYLELERQAFLERNGRGGGGG